MLGRLTKIPRKLNCAPGVPVILIMQLGSLHPTHGNFLVFPKSSFIPKSDSCHHWDSFAFSKNPEFENHLGVVGDRA